MFDFSIGLQQYFKIAFSSNAILERKRMVMTDDLGSLAEKIKNQEGRGRVGWNDQRH